MQVLQLRRLTAVLAVLLLLATAVPTALARGSFGRGGGSFGGGHTFGGGGGRGFGGLFGGGSRPSVAPPPRPAFTPPPRPAFTPAPVPTVSAPRPSLPPTPAPGPMPSSGSFGRAGGVGNPTSNHFTATTGTGGSFGKTGTAGTRSFTSVARHASPPPPPAVNIGRPYAPAFSHSYYYGGRPANAYFTGGYSDYSFGYYGHPYYHWWPWSPVFYYNPPIYMGGGYVSGGFSFLRLLLGLVFWVVVIAVVIAVFRHFRSRQSA